MGNIENHQLVSPPRKPWFSLLSIILLAVGGLLVGQFLAILMVVGIYDYGFFEIQEALSDIPGHPSFKVPIFIIQGWSALFAFIIAPLFYLRFIEHKKLSDLSPVKITSLLPLVLTAMIAIVFMPVNFKFMEWNSMLELTEWMKQQEEMLEELTAFLTTMDNFGQFLLAMLVVAIIPAIGEELLFRGVIQNQFQAWTKSPHVAIWITAIMFSAIHTQFYGFIPRMLLGALFGYLYFWSGSLIIPIVGHFVNNGLQIVMLYIYQNQLTELNIDEVESVPWTVFISTSIITIGLIFYFKRFYNRQSEDVRPGWHKVFSTDKTHQAEIVKAVLSDNQLDPVLINKKDSAYDRFGYIEIHVTSDQVMRARKIIDNDINFE